MAIRLTYTHPISQSIAPDAKNNAVAKPIVTISIRTKSFTMGDRELEFKDSFIFFVFIKIELDI
ncbi:hypothetical protein AY599_05155 [Leptolyngbya valderiana BDU 20041]|nr:hypothetical protein AY599_05155 [Leptolyngbya valderiana BDU 20041]